MKSKIYTILLFSLLVTIMSIPAFAATSKFDFTMKHRVVNGKTNGEYHTLSGGKRPTISGSMYQTGGTTNTGTNEIFVELVNKTSGNSFGSVSLGKPNKNGSKKSFSETFSKKTGGGTKYYLIFYRVESDGRTISGDGSISG